MKEQCSVIAGCPGCMDSSGIIEGHRYCHYPPSDWQKLWDEGKADVVLEGSSWRMFRIVKQEGRYEKQTNV